MKSSVVIKREIASCLAMTRNLKQKSPKNAATFKGQVISINNLFRNTKL